MRTVAGAGRATKNDAPVQVDYGADGHSHGDNSLNA